MKTAMHNEPAASIRICSGCGMPEDYMPDGSTREPCGEWVSPAEWIAELRRMREELEDSKAEVALARRRALRESAEAVDKLLYGKKLDEERWTAITALVRAKNAIRALEVAP